MCAKKLVRLTPLGRSVSRAKGIASIPPPSIVSWSSVSIRKKLGGGGAGVDGGGKCAHSQLEFDASGGAGAALSVSICSMMSVHRMRPSARFGTQQSPAAAMCMSPCITSEPFEQILWWPAIAAVSLSTPSARSHAAGSACAAHAGCHAKHSGMAPWSGRLPHRPKP